MFQTRWGFSIVVALEGPTAQYTHRTQTHLTLFSFDTGPALKKDDDVSGGESGAEVEAGTGKPRFALAAHPFC